MPFDAGADARTLARDIWPASSTKRTSTAPIMAWRAQSQAVPAATFACPLWSALSTAALSCASVTNASLEWGSSSSHRWMPRRDVPVVRDCLHASSSRCVMTLWLLAVMPTFFPARSNASIISAPRWVLPVPGGPWIGSTEPSTASARRTGESVTSPRGVWRVSRATAAEKGAPVARPFATTWSPRRNRLSRSSSDPR